MISVKDNVREVLAFTDRLSKQYEFAVARALTDTAVELRIELYAEQRRVFDRPTRYTQNSMFVRKATRAKLTAEVLLKDRLLSGTTRSHVDTIGHQYTGGNRRAKAIELYGRRAGLMAQNEFLVPGAGARLDSNGNMSRGQVQQVLSQIRLGIDPASFATKSTRSVRNQKRAGLMFWSRGDGHLPRGVWLRTATGVLPVLLVERNLKYDQLVKVQQIGDRVFARSFEANLRRSWASAKATAR